MLEHIAIAALPAAIARLRAMAHHGALLITVPYRERAPLYHHDKPHGHKQSFDDTKIERLFGPSCLFSQYNSKWYFVLMHDDAPKARYLAIDDFKSEAWATLRGQK